MRVKIIGTSDSVASLRGYLNKAGDVAVWKEGDSDPDYLVYLEESSAGDFYCDSVPCEFEQAILRHVRERSSAPIWLCTAGGIRSDHALRIVFPQSQAQAVEIGIQMGFADFAAPRHRAAITAPSSPQDHPDSLARIQEILEELVDKIHLGDSENINLLEKLEDLYERMLLEKDRILADKSALIEKLDSEIQGMRKPQLSAPRPWWQFWKRSAIALIVLMLAGRAANGQTTEPAKPPPPPAAVMAEDREKVQNLWIDAFVVLATIQDLNLQIAKVQADLHKQQDQLDALNARISTVIADIRRRYNAPEDKWCPTRDFAWVPKGDKPCPSIFTKQ